MHVAPDWADIYDTPTKQEKTYLKPCCIPFPVNMSFNPETAAKRWARVWAWTCPWTLQGGRTPETGLDTHDLDSVE